MNGQMLRQKLMASAVKDEHACVLQTFDCSTVRQQTQVLTIVQYDNKARA